MPLDPDHHDQLRVGPMSKPAFRTFKRGRRVRLHPTNEVHPLKRIWLCRVKLVGTSLTTGKTIDLHEGATQRIEETNARYVRV